MATTTADEVVVVSEGQVSGIVTARDIAEHVVAAGLNPFTTQVSEIATCELLSISDCETLGAALRLMRHHDVQRLLVGDTQRSLIGVLHAADLLTRAEPQSLLAALLEHPKTPERTALVA